MPETLAGTYANLAGIEIVNNTRTLTYLKNGLGPASVSVFTDCNDCGNCSSCNCAAIVTLLGCDGVTGYVDPVTDNAPWYSASIPESGGFLGMYIQEFTGLDSPFSRNVTETVNNGGVLSRSRLGTRELTWKGYLFGDTCCSVQYGFRWLKRTLSRFNASCRDCFGDDLEILFCCPDTNETINSPFRLIKGVGLTEGPLIISERKTCSSGCSTGCGGSCILEVEFTMVAAQPYFYSTEIPVYNCVSLGLNGLTTVTDAASGCGPFDCSDDIIATACASPSLPPAADYTNSCTAQVVAQLDKSLYLTVPRGIWPDLDEVVPVITIDNNSGFSYDGVKIGFYSSPSANPCGDLLTNPPLCDVLCDELVIGFIPGQSSFYIDGRTRKMSLICDNNNTAFPGERHTNGPWSWPTFNDYGFCMEVQFIDGPNADDICVSLSLVPRSF